MKRDILIYNTLSRKKEVFSSTTPGRVGLYVCGPTVYGDPHLGHARPAITYDILVRLFAHLGYKVRYVRNITDVGHMESDGDSGEDKIEKKARLEELEPMEVVQYYTIRYHDAMKALNTLPPSIEPRASGHIIEQISLVKEILSKGFAYESNGSVYFDVERYNQEHSYGRLSGRSLDDMMSNSRDLEGQQDKKSPFDFALWKKATPTHIMRWPSPWSEGFPGWHLECSAMSAKYLGNTFDIHGGGMDLLFPHHECELAQNIAARGEGGVRYWMHNNMITINGQKMGKSLGNFITLEELFSGNHQLLEQPFSPMAIRFFILQAHYRSTLDFSNDALIAAEKGYKRLMQAAKEISQIKTVQGEPSKEILEISDSIYAALCDDINTPIALAHLFDAVRIINTAKDGQLTLTSGDIALLDSLFKDIVGEVLGLSEESSAGANIHIIEGVVEMLLQIRKEAKLAKDFAKSDAIRDELAKLGVTVKDTKESMEWSLN